MTRIKIKLRYDGYHGFESFCDVQIEHGHDKILVTVTERDDNPGTSITNRIEVIATKIADMLDDIPVERLHFVEHYPERGSVYRLHAESWAQVEFTWSGREARQPVWSPLNRDNPSEGG